MWRLFPYAKVFSVRAWLDPGANSREKILFYFELIVCLLK